MEQGLLIEQDIETGPLFGSEAVIQLQLRNFFPGLGGDIFTRQTVAAARRREFSTFPGQGLRLCLKHGFLKKCDDYFGRIGRYRYPHIPRPLGSEAGETEGYWYEYVMGSEGFSWFQYTGEGRKSPVQLSEWREFENSFAEVGVNMRQDTVISDGLTAQNIIHQCPREKDFCLNLLWMRIDFGDNSLNIDYDRCGKFLKSNAESLQRVLGANRYEFMLLAYRYLVRGQLEEREFGRLEILTREYRLSSLKQSKGQVMLG